MNPLMALVVDSMRKNRDIYGLRRLLREAVLTQTKFWCRKKKIYMDRIIQVIKKEINEIEDEKK